MFWRLTHLNHMWGTLLDLQNQHGADWREPIPVQV